MAPGFSASRHTISALFVVAIASLGLAGCDTINSLTGRTTDDAKEPVYIERPVDQIYGDAWKQINNGNYVLAAKQFDEVERQHPYSIWARRAMLMSAYCYYHANHYDDAISTAD